MLTTLITSMFSPRFLYAQRCRFRSFRSLMKTREFPVARPLSFFASGALIAMVGLASLTLITQPRERTFAARDIESDIAPAAFVAAQFQEITPSTDGRAIPELPETPTPGRTDEPIATRIDPACAAHAREKLMVGLTNYYLQRRLRPGADNDDVADTSLMTGLLAGPGDPVTTTSESSCRG